MNVPIVLPLGRGPNDFQYSICHLYIFFCELSERVYDDLT